MNRETIDRILATDEELVPSSGFLASVMERVKEEAAAPAPIPFPWKRAIPGMALALAVLGWGAVEVARATANTLRSVSFSTPHLPTALSTSWKDAGWVTMALAVSLAASLLSRRMAGRRGLL